MKIVNRKEFLKLPSGTLYSRIPKSKSRDYCFGVLELKRESLDDDWWFIALTDVQTEDDSESRFDMIDKMYEGQDINNPEYSMERDGFYDEDEMFLIWSQIDKQQLLELLQR